VRIEDLPAKLTELGGNLQSLGSLIKTTAEDRAAGDEAAARCSTA
jgi:hypothetical protein